MSLSDLRELTFFDSSLREVVNDSNALTSAIYQAKVELQKAEENQQQEVVVRLLGYLVNACRISNLYAEAVTYLEQAVLLCCTLGNRR